MTSRLALHTHRGGADIDAAIRSAPFVCIKALNDSAPLATAAAQGIPVRILRLYGIEQLGAGDAVNRWLQQDLSHATHLQLVCEDSKGYDAQWQGAVIEGLAPHYGGRYLIGGFPTGNPTQVTGDPSHFPEFEPLYPLLRRADVDLALDEYGASLPTDATWAQWNPWTAQRHRLIVADLARQGIAVHVAITESGRDDVQPDAADKTAGGWQLHWTAEQYMAFLAALDAGDQADDAVICRCIFTLGGTSDWASFELFPIVPQLAAYVQSQAGGLPVTVDDTLTLWARDVLIQMGIPVTTAPMAMLLAWAQAEGGIGHNNPLNTTLVMTGSTPWNSNGGYPVQAYPDLATGVAATVGTLQSAYYTSIVADLRTGNTSQFAADVYASPWGTKQGIDVAEALASLGVPVPAPIPTGPAAPTQQKGHSGMPASLFQFDQGPGTLDCWVRCIESFFLRYGYTHDVDAIFQAGFGYVRPAGGQAAPFSVVKQAITTLAAQDGAKLQLIDLDQPGQVSAALADPDTANQWTVIAGIAEQDLQPGQQYGHYIVLERKEGDTVTVVDSNQREDGNQTGTYTWEQIVAAMAANWDPTIDGVGAKLIGG